MNIVEILQAARQELVTRGRATGATMKWDETVCLVGALMAVTIPSRLGCAAYYLEWESPEGKLAMQELLKHVPVEYERTGVYRLAQFNDWNPGPEGDQAVFDLIDKTIADLGGVV